MISYVFGAKYDATDIIMWAKKENLFVMEDEAESFSSPGAKCKFYTIIYYSK